MFSYIRNSNTDLRAYNSLSMIYFTKGLSIMTTSIPVEELDKLIKAAEYDLQVRDSLVKSGELEKPGYNQRMKEVHEENLNLLKNFLLRYDWPIPSIHGKKGFEAAWLICIHAIEYPKKMIEGRNAIKELLDQGERVRYEYASLYDRIALYMGGKQRYGTQFWSSEKGWHLKNLEDAERVEEYRAKIGVEPLSQKWKEMESYTDESGYAKNEKIRDQEFEEWAIRAGWRSLDLREASL